jgi:hypothetical protein
VLTLSIQRAGANLEVPVQLDPIGAFNATFPENCPKSDLIVAQALEYLVDTFPDGWKLQSPKINKTVPALFAALASGDARYRLLVDQWGKVGGYGSEKYVPNADLTKGVDGRSWLRGYETIAWTELYHQLRDPDLLASLSLMNANGVMSRGEYPPGYPSSPGSYPGHGLGHFDHIPGIGGYGIMTSATATATLGWAYLERCGMAINEADYDDRIGYHLSSMNATSGDIHYGHRQPGQNSNRDHLGRNGNYALIFAAKDTATHAGRLGVMNDFFYQNYNGLFEGHATVAYHHFFGVLGAKISEGYGSSPSGYRRIMDYHKWFLNMSRTHYGAINAQPLNRDSANYDRQNGTIGSWVLALLTDEVPRLQVQGALIPPDPSVTNWVTIDGLDMDMTEGPGDGATLRFNRVGGTSGDLVVNYTISGHRVEASDIDGGLAGSVTIPDGAASVALSLTAAADGRDEQPEYAKLRIRPDPAFHVGYPGAATLLIDGDAAPVDFRVTEITRSGNDTHLTWASVPGATYGVQAYNLTTESWDIIKSGIPAHPSNSTTTDTVETTAAKVRIYRVSQP